MIGSYATGIYEPCQIRKEAAVSGHSRVPQGSLVGVNCVVTACSHLVEGRCTALKIYKPCIKSWLILFLATHFGMFYVIISLTKDKSR